MVSANFDDDPQVGYVVLKPHRSISWRDNLVFVALVGAIYVASAAIMTARGFWPVIPWAIADLALLFGCLYFLARAATRREVIYFDRDQVRVERGQRSAESSLAAPRVGTYCIVRALKSVSTVEHRIYLRLGTVLTEVGAALGPLERDRLLAALAPRLPIYRHDS
jgi:uncharacterized membrane protein